MFVYAESYLLLEELLQYEEGFSEWQVKPVAFYSPLDGHKTCELSLKLSNNVNYRQADN